jgi:hypothetical protein
MKTRSDRTVVGSIDLLRGTKIAAVRQAFPVQLGISSIARTPRSLMLDVLRKTRQPLSERRDACGDVRPIRVQLGGIDVVM